MHIGTCSFRFGSSSCVPKSDTQRVIVQRISIIIRNRNVNKLTGNTKESDQSTATTLLYRIQEPYQSYLASSDRVDIVEYSKHDQKRFRAHGWNENVAQNNTNNSDNGNYMIILTSRRIQTTPVIDLC